MQGYNGFMKPNLILIAALCAACLGASLGASATAQTPATAQAPKDIPEPKVERLTVIDESVQINELRVRGESQGVKVAPKSAPAYDISPQSAAKRIDDKSQGVRTWRLFSF